MATNSQQPQQKKPKAAPKAKPQLSAVGRPNPPMRMRASTMQMPSLRNMGLRQPPMAGRRAGLPGLAGVLPSLPQPPQAPAPPSPSLGVGGGRGKSKKAC